MLLKISCFSSFCAALLLAAGSPAIAAADKIDLTTWDQAELYQGWSAKELFNKPVRSENGEEIGDVENIIVNADSQIEKIIIEAGGFLDIGDTHLAAKWDQVRFTPGGEALVVPFDPDSVPAFSLFDNNENIPSGPRAWRATELLDDYVKLKDAPAYALVDDLIFDREGRLQAIVVIPDVAYGVHGRFAYPYYGYRHGYDPGSDTYELPYTRSEINNLKPFDHSALKLPQGLSSAKERPQNDAGQNTAMSANAAQDKIDLATWDQAKFYKGWSAEEMFNKPVRAENGEEIGHVENIIVDAEGRVKKIIVEAGGFLDIGDTHLGVNWDQVKLAPEDEALVVPIDPDSVPAFSLFDNDENIPSGPRAWRATELLGDYVKLKDVPAFAIVDDLIFDKDGQLQAVVVIPDIVYGVPGRYLYPFYGYRYGYDPGSDTYDLPYNRDEISNLKPFDYSALSLQD